MSSKTMKPLFGEDAAGIHVDPDAFGFEKSESGIDYLCGHCGAVVFEKYAAMAGMKITMAGIVCAKCGGSNELDV